MRAKNFKLKVLSRSEDKICNILTNLVCNYGKVIYFTKKLGLLSKFLNDSKVLGGNFVKYFGTIYQFSKY